MQTLRALGFCAVALLFTAPVAPAQPSSEPSPRNSVKLARVIVALPAGTPWLNLKIGITFCSGDGYIRTWAGGRESQDLAPFLPSFKTEMARAGYSVITPGEDNLFDPDAATADYQVAAVIVDEHVSGCISRGGMFTSTNVGDVRGQSDMKVDWQIYSPVQKQVVAHVSTSATVKLDNSVPGGEQRLVVESFAGNARELASNAEFRAATSGARPPADSILAPGKQDKIALAGSLKAGKRPISDAVGSVVTILTGSGSGSGDLMSNDGYMLTNAHVVADEKQVRVRWSDGIETVAEVVRVDKSRDVALIKTNSRDREPLAIKRGAVTPGARVFAIGSPLGKAYQGTVSSGVVSAIRTIEGLRYIQSDVAISHGSSGGALLDENGAVIGITVSRVEQDGPTGINFFIPIGDALDFLNLEPK